MHDQPDVDEQIRLPPSQGATVCDFQAWRGTSGSVLVVVTELPDNPGLSVSLNFAPVAEAARPQLPRGAHDPVWIEMWPGRSLAAFVLHDTVVPAHHLVSQHGESWWRRPLSVAATRHLLWLVAGEHAARAYRG